MKDKLIPRFIKMFGCDTARIADPMGTKFLIIGWNRNTRDDADQWTKNGEPINFDYVKEMVVASGRTYTQLIVSAKEYKRLSEMGMEDYLKELIPGLKIKCVKPDMLSMHQLNESGEGVHPRFDMHYKRRVK